MNIKDRFIAAISLALVALGLIMAFYCEPGFVKIIGIVITIASIIIAIDYMADEI